MLKKLARILNREHRDFEVFQIEVSTYSSLECQVCPRAVFAEQWDFQNMSMGTFQEIGQYFHLTKWVSLRGWGEPMENENIIPMLHLAKKNGCLTSLTTNGIRLTEDLSHQLLMAGLDLIVVSVELATQGIQEGLPAGADFERILKQITGFIQLKNKLHHKTPTVKISFPMTRLNMKELPSLVPLAAKLGVDEVIFTNLDYLPDERWNILRAFYHESPTAAFQQSIDEIHRLSKALRILVKTYPLKVEEQRVCEANPPRNVFFSVDGSVAPCHYLRIPKKGDIPRIFMNKESMVPQTSFGNIKEEDLLAVLNKESYKKFRGIFEERKKAERDMVQLLDIFSNIRPSDMKEEVTKVPPPFPEVCQTCYKAYGI
ncbi:MAG: SPASM domain-containing protein [Thermodesulfobacteriota bacterium]